MTNRDDPERQKNDERRSNRASLKLRYSIRGEGAHVE
jgi:hypothetical protein